MRRGLARLVRFSMRRGLRSIEVKPEDFRRQLANKHGLWVPHLSRMQDVPIERLDQIARELIRDAGRLALIGGAGFGFAGMITFLPDASLLTAITLRLIQRLCLLYGFAPDDHEERAELWLAAAAAAGMDYGRDVAEKKIAEKLAPRVAERLAIQLGQEAAEKWIGRLIPVASSALGGALNFSFVRVWGNRVHQHLRARHLSERRAESAPIGRSGPRVSLTVN